MRFEPTNHWLTPMYLKRCDVGLSGENAPGYDVAETSAPFSSLQRGTTATHDVNQNSPVRMQSQPCAGCKSLKIIGSPGEIEKVLIRQAGGEASGAGECRGRLIDENAE